MIGLGLSVSKAAVSDEFIVSNLSEVVTWLKADTGVTETSTDSGVVARWRDNVGTTDWVSNTSTRQPSVSGTGVNTKLTFDGGDRLYQKEYDWNTTDDAFDFDFPHDVFDVMNAGGSGGLTFFVVMEVDSSLGQTVHSILTEAHFVDDGTPGSGFTARTDISGTIALYTKADFINVGGVNAGAVAFNSGTSAGAEFPLDEKFLATIGSLGLNTNGIKGDLYELINCSSKLSSSNRDLVENYLMTRHSIS